MDDQTGSMIVGTQGDFLYLIERADGLGQVAHTGRGVLLAPQPLVTFLTRREWVPCDDVAMADVMALVGPVARLRKLATMAAWAIFDGCIEPGDDHRLPVRRALSFAWADANVLGDFAVRRSECGCQTRFGRTLVLCWPHGVEGD